jgi:uncharacterized protein (TIGR03083 family)
MNDRTSQTIRALRTGHDELATLVSSMGSDQLSQLSGASKWDISQVLGHLGSSAEIGLVILEAALKGAANPGMEYYRTVWTRWDAMGPGERAANFLHADEALVHAYESLDETAKAELRVDVGFLPEPVDVSTVAALRLSELTYHTWDIKVVFDPAAVLAPAAVELLVDRLGMIIGFLGHADALADRPVTLALQITAPDRSFGLDLRDTVTLIDVPEHSDGTLSAPAEAWLRLAAGRFAPRYASPAVQLTSDIITLDDLRRVFPGF